MKVGGADVEGMMPLGKVGHLCQTEGQDSTYGFTGANARFGGANACYHPLQPHSDFLRGGPSYEGPPPFPSQSEVQHSLSHLE